MAEPVFNITEVIQRIRQNRNQRQQDSDNIENIYNTYTDTAIDYVNNAIESTLINDDSYISTYISEKKKLEDEIIDLKNKLKKQNIYFLNLFEQSMENQPNKIDHDTNIYRKTTQNDFMEMLLCNILYKFTTPNVRLFGSACRLILSPEKFHTIVQLGDDVTIRKFEFVGTNIHIIGFVEKLKTLGNIEENVIYDNTIGEHRYFKNMNIQMVKEIILYVGKGDEMISNIYQFYNNSSSKFIIKIILYTLDPQFSTTDNYNDLMSKWLIFNHSQAYTAYHKDGHGIVCEEFTVKNKEYDLTKQTLVNLWLSLRYQFQSIDKLHNEYGDKAKIISFDKAVEKSYLANNNYTKMLRKKLIASGSVISYIKPLGEIYTYKFNKLKKTIKEYLENDTHSFYILDILASIDKDLPRYKDKCDKEIIENIFDDIDNIVCSLANDELHNDQMIIVTPCGHIYTAKHLIHLLTEYCRMIMNRVNNVSDDFGNDNPEDNVNPTTKNCPMCGYELLNFDNSRTEFNMMINVKDKNIGENFSKFFKFNTINPEISESFDRFKTDFENDTTT